MEIVINTRENNISKEEIEILQEQQKEYLLLGTYELRKGMLLWGYDAVKGHLFPQIIAKNRDLCVEIINNEITVEKNLSTMKIVIDSCLLYFQATGWKAAQKKVKQFRDGKIKTLFNLRQPEQMSIDKIFPKPKYIIVPKHTF